MRESKLWAKLKREVANKNLAGFWHRVEVKYPAGFPDTIVILDTLTLFVELKSVEKIKDLKHELRPEQAVWHRNWRDKGGFCYVLAWVESERRLAWFSRAWELRQGIFCECLPPYCIAKQDLLSSGK